MIHTKCAISPLIMTPIPGMVLYSEASIISTQVEIVHNEGLSRPHNPLSIFNLVKVKHDTLSAQPKSIQIPGNLTSC